ncbi:MAG TPA: molybdopterin-binding oxidoreductase, partial [Acidobacteriaceae bacterium]
MNEPHDHPDRNAEDQPGQTDAASGQPEPVDGAASASAPAVSEPAVTHPVEPQNQAPEDEATEADLAAAQQAANQAVLAESRNHTRRSFVVAAIGAAAGYGFYRWIENGPGIEMQ